MESIWTQVMKLKSASAKEESKGVNMLTDDELEAILGTIDFFGGDYHQDYFDLAANAKPFAPRYRVFDWLAMRVQGRHSGSEAETTVTKVLVHSFIKAGGVPSKFIQDLRETDYDMDHSWESIDLGK